MANERSIAWSACQVLYRAGAELTIVYQNERLLGRIDRLVRDLDKVKLVQCDVTSDVEIINAFSQIEEKMGGIDCLVHSIAFAQREDLGGDFSDLSRDGFHIAMEVSAYSLIPLVKHAAKLIDSKGGSIVAMTFQASQRVFPGYNVMGTAKAALENTVKQLAAEYGRRNIRVNAISAGPLETLAARGIKGFKDMRSVYAERSPLRRNITHEEVANTTLFLASDLASGITGTIIPVDAGYHIMAV